MGGDRQLDRRQHDGVHPPGPRGLVRRHVHQHVTAADLEERVVVHPARRTGRLADHRVQLGHRSGVPAQDLVLRHVALDRRDLDRRDRPELDVDGRGLGREQPAQRRHGSARAVQLRLEAVQVLRDETCACVRVGGRHDASDLGQRDVELAQPVDDLGGRDLVGAVVAVAAGGVDGGRDQQVRVVVAAQCAHAQVGQSRELADRQHAGSVHPPPAGGSSA